MQAEGRGMAALGALGKLGGPLIGSLGRSSANAQRRRFGSGPGKKNRWTKKLEQK